MDESRPDPDQLLEELKRDEEKEQRGRLKIFFGASAGVGKTYAMLLAAQAQRAQGVDVAVGVIETHGRGETAALLAGLEALPPKRIDYRGKQLVEFDLDGALVRKPALILVDELAHSNVPGSRHPKRWQDVEELLASGIDVYTTLNVQHLESLNDVVGKITGVRVAETLPDRVFDRADDVALVDLTPDELLRRFGEGKVYMPQQAQRALKHFFRKGNLIALRELALRRTADRVNADMREYRADQAIQGAWQTKERLLVCVGPDPGAANLVRGASRLAAKLDADWLAVYVETPRLERLPQARREQILKTLRLAQGLGAEAVTLAGTDLAATVLDYARVRNVSRLVVGKSTLTGLARLWRPALAERLAERARDVDIHIVAGELDERGREGAPPVENTMPVLGTAGRRIRWRHYLYAVAVSAATTALTAALLRFFDLANVVMLYLLGVVLVAVFFGRGPAVLASLLSVAAFDFFFVEPQLSFTVNDTQYVFTFALMLAVALLTSNLTANLRYQARVATRREQRTGALYALGKELAAALTGAQIVEISSRHLQAVFQARVALLLPDGQDRVRQPDPAADAPAVDASIAQWVYDHQQAAGLGTHTLSASPVHYLPLRAPMRTRGVLAIAPRDPGQLAVPEQSRLLDTFAAQIALALERVHYVEVARDALVSMESERLRNSLLSAISHDLRTPLAALVGLADTLLGEREPDPKTRRELTHAIHEEALRMSGLMSNLLDLARLQAGGVRLNRQWQMLEEVIGGALRAMRNLLASHRIELRLARDLPLVNFDAVLIERALCNLLENATKYTPPGTLIEIAVESRDKEIWLSVQDNGPGLPAGLEDKIFGKFIRGEKESAKPGVGLGLALCCAIAAVHNGRIWAENRPRGGARFTLALPLGEPPALPEPDDPAPPHTGPVS